MSAVNRFSLAACALLLCGQLAGCASVKPMAAPGAMSQAEMERIGVEAEQALAAGDLVAAGSGYVRIVTAFPDSAPAWFRLGTIYLRTNQNGPAQRAFEESLRADPTLTKAHANLALAHLAQFRHEAGRAVLSTQVPEANRVALQALLDDVNHVFPPLRGGAPAGDK